MERRDFIKGMPLLVGGILFHFPRLTQASSRRLASARTFYVDSKAGDDANSGLNAGQAWKSLDRVNREVFQPGDRVLFKAGTRYQGQFKPQGSGAVVDGEVHPIVAGRYGNGPKPVLEGQGRFPTTVHLYNVEYWEVTDLEITNTGSEREAGRKGVFVQVMDFGTAHHIHLKNLYVHDVNGSLVKKQGGGSAIAWSNGGREKQSRFDGLLIENCHIQNCGRNAITAGGYWNRQQWFPSLNVVIRRNLIEGVPGDGIVPSCTDGALVEHNVMRDCPRLLPDGEAAAGIWPWSSDNTIIQYNEVSDHKAPWDAQGFDSDWNCRNTLIQYNYSHDNEGGFLLVCNDGNVKMPTSVGNVGTVVRYNISVNDGLRPTPTPQKGMFSPTFHISGPVVDTKIYNNLIYVPKKPLAEIDRTLVQMDNWGGPWPEDTVFTNNIFDVAEETRWDDGKAIGTVWERNLYNGLFTNPPTDPKGLRDAPGFVREPAKAPAGRDKLAGFRLKKGSPAINAGKPIAENGGRDFLGRPVSSEGQPTIGPLED